MNEFEKRDQAFENKFAHNQELEFRAAAKRNKNIALWAADKLGKSTQDTEQYAKELIEINIQNHGDTELLNKIVADFAKAGLSISEADIRREIGRLFEDAHEQIMCCD